MGPGEVYWRKREMSQGKRSSFYLDSVSSLRPPLQKRAKFTAARGVPQLAERLRFDLPDALARDGEALADLLERVLAAVADAEPHLDDLLFPRCERLEHRIGLFLQVQ